MIIPHPTLQAGSPCPACVEVHATGKLYQDSPQVLVRLQGRPLITGVRYFATCLRCHLCGDRYQASFPSDIKKAPKYDASALSTLAIGRYYLGLPMYRMEQHQGMHGTPLKDSTQWDLLKKLDHIVSPVHAAMVKKSADGSLMVYDDTPGRILDNQAMGLATHTTAFISVCGEHKIHLFFTGRNHAGNNADAILAKRTSEEPVIAMMDASPSNIPKKMSAALTARFILCFCLTHGRRKFFEVFNFFDKECDFVLDMIGLVYKQDAHCNKEGYTPEQRLHYHQTYSQPLMESLYLWLNNQLFYDQKEPNGGFGQAINYMLRHWAPLTTFLRVAGAPLDSSWAERAIKIAIRHRRNSLFYKTAKGALVGDCLMSLIYTAQQNGINPYDYLNTLQEHADRVAARPDDWFPWNYRKTLAAPDVLAALAA